MKVLQLLSVQSRRRLRRRTVRGRWSVIILLSGLRFSLFPPLYCLSSSIGHSILLSPSSILFCLVRHRYPLSRKTALQMVFSLTTSRCPAAESDKRHALSFHRSSHDESILIQQPGIRKSKVGKRWRSWWRRRRADSTPWSACERWD